MPAKWLRCRLVPSGSGESLTFTWVADCLTCEKTLGFPREALGHLISVHRTGVTMAGRLLDMAIRQARVGYGLPEMPKAEEVTPSNSLT